MQGIREWEEEEGKVKDRAGDISQGGFLDVCLVGVEQKGQYSYGHPPIHLSELWAMNTSHPKFPPWADTMCSVIPREKLKYTYMFFK